MTLVNQPSFIYLYNTLETISKDASTAFSKQCQTCTSVPMETAQKGLKERHVWQFHCFLFNFLGLIFHTNCFVTKLPSYWWKYCMCLLKCVYHGVIGDKYIDGVWDFNNLVLHEKAHFKVTSTPHYRKTLDICNHLK